MITIEDRLKWIEERAELSPMARHFVKLQMGLHADFYHRQQVKKCDLADVGGALPSIHVECNREGTMQEHNYLPSMERKGYAFITCETRMVSGGRYTYYYFRKQ